MLRLDAPRRQAQATAYHRTRRAEVVAFARRAADARRYCTVAPPASRLSLLGLGWFGWTRAQVNDGETCGSLMQEGVWLVWIRGPKAMTVEVVLTEIAA
jgi:hypothetical protein